VTGVAAFSLVLVAVLAGPVQADGPGRAPSAAECLEVFASGDEEAAARASGELVALGRAVVPLLLARLETAGPVAFRRIVAVLGALGDERAESALVAALDSPDRGIAAAACRAVVGVRESPSLDVLRRIGGLAGHADASVRRAAAAALMATPSPDALPFLASGLTDDDPAVRATCQDAYLARRVDPGAYDLTSILLDRLDKAGVRPRAEIARVLSCVGDGRARDALLSLARDDDPEVVAAVLPSLARFPGEETVRAAVRALHSRDASVRRAAARSLAAAGDPRAAARLVSRLRDGDAGVRAEALRGLRALTGADCGELPDRWRREIERMSSREAAAETD